MISLQNYKHYLDTVGEFGIVREVKYPLIIATGLPKVKPHEIVIFETGQMGEVFSIERSEVKILLFSTEAIQAGTKIVRTNSHLSIQVGQTLLGSIINPLGNSIFDSHFTHLYEGNREIEGTLEAMENRLRITRPLLTGVSLVDIMIPLGKGQRELIIGDRKTGKTAFLLSTIQRQIAEGTIVIYAAIGKKKSDIKSLYEYFKKNNLSQSTVMVCTSSFDSPSMIFLTPYTAMSIAEYFKDNGKDVLVIFDDLSTHAKFYREMSLLSGSFPGRDSYPGDIFYAHARLVERAGNFKSKNNKEVSITALPVVEIVEGDFTGHIATNLMGMTDGHIYFDSNAYYNGRRPAVNIALSVTRVGRQTQTPLKRAINHELSAFLSSYEKMQNFSHFGAELSAKVKNILKTGEKMYDFFDQHFMISVPEEIQLIMFALIWLRVFNDQTTDFIHSFRENLIKAYYEQKNKQLFENITNIDNFDNLLSFVSQNRDKYIELCKTSKV